MIWKIILSLFRGPARPNSARVCALVCVGGSSYPSQLLHVLTKHINGHGDLDVFHCDGQLLLLADRQAEWRGAKLCWKFTLQFVIVNSSALKHNMSPLRSSGLDERREEKKAWVRAVMSLGGLNGHHSSSVCWIWPLTSKGLAAYSSDRQWPAKIHRKLSAQCYTSEF